jgi:cell division septation protein DedD
MAELSLQNRGAARRMVMLLFLLLVAAAAAAYYLFFDPAGGNEERSVEMTARLESQSPQSAPSSRISQKINLDQSDAGPAEEPALKKEESAAEAEPEPEAPAAEEPTPVVEEPAVVEPEPAVEAEPEPEAPAAEEPAVVEIERPRVDPAPVGSRPVWAINVLSTQDPEKVRNLMDRLADLPYRVYTYQKKIKGRNWRRVRVGFFGSKTDAERVGVFLMGTYDLEEPWVVKPGPQELSRFFQ